MPRPTQKMWTEVDEYFGDHLLKSDAALDAILAANRKAGLPPIDVTPLQGKFLELLVRMSSARTRLSIDAPMKTRPDFVITGAPMVTEPQLSGI